MIVHFLFFFHLISFVVSSNLQYLLKQLERQLRINRDEDEAAAFRGNMDEPKLPNMIRISGCNPNIINVLDLQSQLQHSLDLDIDIQCYSEVNANLIKSNLHQKFHELTKRSYQLSKSTWGTSQAQSDSDYKAGGTGIVSIAACAIRAKKEGQDRLRRWMYKILDRRGKRDVLILSIYQCCNSNNETETLPAAKQQRIMLSEMNRKDTDSRRNLRRDITEFIQKLKDENDEIVPIIIGD